MSQSALDHNSKLLRELIDRHAKGSQATFVHKFFEYGVREKAVSALLNKDPRRHGGGNFLKNLAKAKELNVYFDSARNLILPRPALLEDPTIANNIVIPGGLMSRFIMACQEIDAEPEVVIESIFEYFAELPKRDRRTLTKSGRITFRDRAEGSSSSSEPGPRMGSLEGVSERLQSRASEPEKSDKP